MVRGSLSEYLMLNYPCYVGQAEGPASVAEGKLLVVNAHQGQQRGVEIVDVHAAVHGFHADFIRRSVTEALLDARAGQETWNTP